MARWTKATSLQVSVRKASSQGVGGRGRRTKCATSTMNKSKRRSYKKYRGQGR